MNRACNTKGMRLYFDPKQRFVEKLYEVVQDDYLLKWNNEGTSMLLHSHNYEDKVMSSYPGFVTIPNFRNLRNFCRQYGFSCKKRRGANFEFTHALFQRGKKELLSQMSCCKRSPSGVDGPPRPPGRPPNSGKKGYHSLRSERKSLESSSSFSDVCRQDGPAAFATISKDSLRPEKHTVDGGTVDVPPVPFPVSTLARKDFDCDPVTIVSDAAHSVLPANKYFASPDDNSQLSCCTQTREQDRSVGEASTATEDSTEIVPTPGFEWMYMYPEVEDDLDHDLFSIIGDLPSLSRYIPPSSRDFLPGVMYRLSGPHPYPPRVAWPPRRF